MIRIAFVIVVAIVVAGILPRVKARTALRKETTEMAVPTVSVVQPKRSAPAQEIVLPANVQAFSDSPIYARTNGYLKHWYVDIGTHVRKGQLLAELEKFRAMSGCGCEVKEELVPVAEGADLEQALSSGEEAQLLCAGPPEVVGAAGLTVIGSLRGGGTVTLVDARGNPRPIAKGGYRHFA